MNFESRSEGAPNRAELKLLREVIEHVAPERSELLAAAAANILTRAQREELCSYISAEFSRVGLGEGYEPNRKGVELESLLDTINRPNLGSD